MIGFKDFTQSNEGSSSAFALEQYKTVVDAYAEQVAPIDAKPLVRQKAKVIESVYKDIAEVGNTIYNVMNGRSVNSVTVDEESGEKTITYFDVPTTITALKNTVVTIIVRDFSDKVSARYDTMTAEDFSTAVKYVVDKVIAFSDGSGSNTFTTFKTYFVD